MHSCRYWQPCFEVLQSKNNSKFASMLCSTNDRFFSCSIWGANLEKRMGKILHSLFQFSKIDWFDRMQNHRWRNIGKLSSEIFGQRTDEADVFFTCKNEGYSHIWVGIEDLYRRNRSSKINEKISELKSK